MIEQLKKLLEYSRHCLVFTGAGISTLSGIPDFQTFLKNPVEVIYQIVLRGEERLQEIKKEMNTPPKVYLISGILGGGKTTFVRTVAEILKVNHRRVGGFVSVRLVEKEKTIGYDLLDLATNESEKFLRIGTYPDKKKIGRFSIFPQGIKKGREALDSSLNSPMDLVVVDEVGKLELQGDGWADSLQKLMDHPQVLHMHLQFQRYIF